MFLLYANKTQLAVNRGEPITSGSVNVYRVKIDFSMEWDGLARMAVFSGSGKRVSILLDESGECTIPWEVLISNGRILEAGVYGTRDGEIVLPTVWANLGMILPGVSPGEAGSRPPTPDLWEQELARKGDLLQYTEDGNLGLYSGDKLLSAVPVTGGGGAGRPVYQLGYGLKLTGNTVSVNAVDNFNGDNTLPMTAAGVYTTVGNIESLLGTI